jgi:hypothetical protein
MVAVSKAKLAKMGRQRALPLPQGWKHYSLTKVQHEITGVIRPYDSVCPSKRVVGPGAPLQVQVQQPQGEFSLQNYNSPSLANNALVAVPYPQGQLRLHHQYEAATVAMGMSQPTQYPHHHHHHHHHQQQHPAAMGMSQPMQYPLHQQQYHAVAGPFFNDAAAAQAQGHEDYFAGMHGLPAQSNRDTFMVSNFNDNNAAAAATAHISDDEIESYIAAHASAQAQGTLDTIEGFDDIDAFLACGDLAVDTAPASLEQSLQDAQNLFPGFAPTGSV